MQIDHWKWSHYDGYKSEEIPYPRVNEIPLLPLLDEAVKEEPEADSRDGDMRDWPEDWVDQYPGARGPRIPGSWLAHQIPFVHVESTASAADINARLADFMDALPPLWVPRESWTNQGRLPDYAAYAECLTFRTRFAMACVCMIMVMVMALRAQKLWGRSCLRPVCIMALD